MFSKRSNPRALEAPPIANGSESVEVLRVWSATSGAQQVALRTNWEDPGAWGLLLVDVARHAAKAYAAEGKDSSAVLARIRQLFDAEWSDPTDEPKDITVR